MDIENSGEKNKKNCRCKGTVPYHLKMYFFFFLFNTFHFQFVQFGHLVESIYICVPSLSWEALNVSPFMLQIFFFFFFVEEIFIDTLPHHCVGGRR